MNKNELNSNKSAATATEYRNYGATATANKQSNRLSIDGKSLITIDSRQDNESLITTDDVVYQEAPSASTAANKFDRNNFSVATSNSLNHDRLSGSMQNFFHRSEDITSQRRANSINDDQQHNNDNNDAENESDESEGDNSSLDSSSDNQEIIANSMCGCSYIIEPLVFLQALASSIIGIAYGQFVYNRILERLIDQSGPSNSTNFTSTTTMSPYLNFSTTTSETTTTLTPAYTCNATHEPATVGLRSSSSYQSMNFNYFFGVLFNLILMPLNQYISPTFTYPLLNSFMLLGHDHMGVGTISPADYRAIRIKAQEETANLFFMCGLFGGLPVILITNLLSVNCSVLGRKPLIIISQIGFVLRFIVILLQCIYVDWPDWVFYVGALIEGLSGSSSVFFLAIHCFITDLTSISSRSYRLTFVNYTSSIASLCVTFLCGYIIKYYGYLYLFATSVILAIIALFYTLFLIPESYTRLNSKSFCSRVKACSIKKVFNGFKVYLPTTTTTAAAAKQPSSNDDVYDEDDDDYNERTGLLTTKNNSSSRKSRLQVYIIMLIVFANFIYNFSGAGMAAIFTLFIMNEPYCFDSIDISNYTLFSTVVTLVMSLLVSKCFRINDLLICLLSVISHFSSIFCYVYGNTPYYIFLGAIIGSISGLEYGYVRSIVSKSFDKREVPDALSLIVTIDTFANVVSAILFPTIYARLVSIDIKIIFYVVAAIDISVILFHIINWIFYKRPERSSIKGQNHSRNILTVSVNDAENEDQTVDRQPQQLPSSGDDQLFSPTTQSRIRRNISKSAENLVAARSSSQRVGGSSRRRRHHHHHHHFSSNYFVPIASANNLTTDSLVQPFHQSIVLSSVEIE